MNILTVDEAATALQSCRSTEQVSEGTGPENLQDSDALWRSSGGPILELRGLAKAATRLAEADALDVWLAAGGDETSTNLHSAAQRREMTKTRQPKPPGERNV